MTAVQNTLARPAAPPADPVALAIEAHRAAWAALEAHAEGPAVGKVAAEAAAWEALLEVRPAGPAGFLRQLRYIAGAEPMEALNDARDLGRNLAEAAEHALRPPASSSPDPILALVEASRQADAARAAFDLEDTSAMPDMLAREREVTHVQVAAWNAVWATTPTTREGRRALITFARRHVAVCTGETGVLDGAEMILRDVLDAFSAAVEAETPEPAVTHPDAALIALGRAFLAAWRDEGSADNLASASQDDAGAQAAARAATQRVTRLSDLIAASSAATVEGLGVKALAAAYLASEGRGPDSPGPEPVGGPMASDVRLLWQIRSGAAQLLATTAPAPVSDEGPEALALVSAIEDAWAADARRQRGEEDDDSPDARARYEAALSRRDALLDAAERLSATTRAGRHAKALALAWLDHVEHWRRGWPRGRYALDGRLAVDIETSLAGEDAR